MSTIMMVRQPGGRVILIVEGEDDAHALRPHIDSNLLMYPGVGGRSSLVEAATWVDKSNLVDVKFLIDSDLDIAVGGMGSVPQALVSTSNHDIFMDLILVAPSVLDYVIETHARAHVRRGGKCLPSEVRKAAFDLAGKVAALRVASAVRGWDLTFAKFPFGALSTSSADFEELARLVIARSNEVVDVSVLVGEAEAFLARWGSMDKLIGDHDLFAALALVLREGGVKVGADGLLNSFMTSIRCSTVMGTTWFSSLSEWAEGQGKSAFACPSHDAVPAL
ncbi:hypothetical protein [Janibacter hoylei]|uniref:hypothetical protein n=1 Tax=Janibacter hoylei TaxID=364298 RepID=UPI0021A55AD1|nr:hypothetical protein [Janibacter hoylei]MCT1617588.1 hypothetical protein [Janibacter hoylei]MCT2292803.1 hypothetical protein [Janibacter hoylei]